MGPVAAVGAVEPDGFLGEVHVAAAGAEVEGFGLQAVERRAGGGLPLAGVPVGEPGRRTGDSFLFPVVRGGSRDSHLNGVLDRHSVLRHEINDSQAALR